MKPLLIAFGGARFSHSHRRPPAPFLELLAGAAGSHFIPPDLGSGALWFACEGTGTDLPMRLKILVSAQVPSRHVWFLKMAFTFLGPFSAVLWFITFSNLVFHRRAGTD